MRAERGFLLLPVVIILALVAALGFMANRQAPGAASLAGGERDAALARVVAEAGLQHALWRANRNACTGYDLASTPFGAHAYQAAFTPASGSPVSVVATGTTAAGASATLSRDGVTVHDGVTTTVLQPDAAAGADTFLEQGWPSENYGKAVTLWLHPVWERALLRFDLSSLPAGARVLKAELALYQTSGGGGAGPDDVVTVHRVTRDWTEGTGDGAATGDGATWLTSDGSQVWLTAGGDHDAAVVAANGNVAGTGWKTWDATALVQDWLSGAIANQGVLLKASAGLGYLKYHSSDATSATLRPRLSVTYYGCECGGGVSGTTVLTPGVGGEDTYIADAGSSNSNFGDAALLRLSNKVNNSKRGLLRFNLAGILPNAVVNGATLELNLEGIGSAADTTVTAYAVDTAWQENTATWNAPAGGSPWTTLGGDYDPGAPVASAPAYYQPSTTVQPVQWNVTPLVRDWVTGARANRGLILVAADGTNHADFTTGDGIDPARPKPKLTVSYSCPCGTTCSVPTVPASDYYLDGFAAACTDAAAYEGSDGTLDWSGHAWSELGDDGDPCTSQVKLVSDLGSQRLRLGRDGNGLVRTVNLLGFERAVLQLDYRRDGLTAGASHLALEASTDGVGWTEVGRVEAGATDTNYQRIASDVTAFVAADTRIRLRVSSSDDLGFFYVDEVRIDQDVGALAAPSQTFTPLADTTLVAGDPVTVFGAQNAVTLSDTEQYGLLRFDTSSVAPGTLISNAKLRVHVKTHGPQGGGGDSVVSVHKLSDPLLRDWNEAEATWVTRKTGLWWPVPGAYQASLPLISAATLPRSTTGVWLEFDITALTQEWIDFPAQNIGVLARLNLARTFSVYSKDDAGNPQLQPQLVVSF